MTTEYWIWVNDSGTSSPFSWLYTIFQDGEPITEPLNIVHRLLKIQNVQHVTIERCVKP